VVAPDFSFRSKRIALDFAATLMFRVSNGPPTELLDSADRLAEWVREADVLSAPPLVRADELPAALSLREAIYRTATARIAGTGGAPDDIALLNRFARRSPPTLTLTADRAIIRAGSIESVLAALARDAVELLGGPDASRLRQCARHGCTRMFVDRSRGQNRTWCGMRQCGNRVNAAAYRRRRRTETPH